MCCECVDIVDNRQPNVCTIDSGPRRGSAAVVLYRNRFCCYQCYQRHRCAGAEQRATNRGYVETPAAARQHFVVLLRVTAAAVKMHY